MARRKGAHHQGTHQARARKIVSQANANPNQRCLSPQCKHDNGTLAQHKPGARWTAGHINDGQINGPLQPEVDECNFAAGARLGHQRRTGHTTTRQW